MSFNTLMSDHQFSAFDENSELYRLACELFPGPAFIIHRQLMQFICVNRMACDITGYNDHELLKLGPHDLDVQYTKEALAIKFDTIIASKEKTGVLVTTQQRKDGTRFQSEMHVKSFGKPENTILIASQRNITDRKITSDKLEKNEEHLRLLVNNIKDHAIYMIDPGGIVKTWNEGAKNIKGYTADEIIGQNISVFYFQEDIDNNVNSIILQLAKEKGSIETEGWRIRKDKSTFWASVTFFAIYDDNQNLEGFAKITRDITAQKMMREKLDGFNRELKEQVRSKTAELTNIFERITDGFVAIDSNWCYTYANNRAGEIFHLNPSDIIGRPMKDTMPEMAELPIFTKYQEAMATQKPVTSEAYFPDLDRWFINNIYPSPHGLSIFFREITEQKKNQEKLERHESRYRAVVEHASDAIVITDQKGHYLDVNPSACKLLGYTREEMLCLSAKDVAYETEVLINLPETFKLLKSGKTNIRDVKLRRKDGSFVEVESRSVMLPDGNFFGIIRDITERKKIEKKLKASEATLKEAQRLAKVGDWSLDHRDKAVYWSEEAYRIFGISQDEDATYELFFQLVHPDDRPWMEEAFKKSVDQRSEYDIIHRIITKDGILKYVNERGKTFYNDHGLPERSIGTVQDITERKKAEQSIQRSEAKFKRIFDSNMVGFIFYNLNGDIVEANDRFLEMLGYTREDLRQGKMSWKDMTPADYVNIDNAAIAQIIATGACEPFDKEYIRKDGSRISVTVAAASLDESQYESGVAYILDISERKRAEEEIRQSQIQLRQLAAHLQTIREEERALMARDIHDELGQQLTGLKMDLYWLNNHPKITDDERRNKINDTIKLVDQTINSVRKIAAELRPSMLDDLGLVEALEWYSGEFQRRSGITVKLTCTVPTVNADPMVSIGLFRIFQESLTNVARHAEAKSVESSIGLDDNQILLRISDNGKGFDKQKNLRNKTLGLLGMKERTLMMGGQYEIISQPGCGTTVLVTVPLPK